jgi:hypothetical protein
VTHLHKSSFSTDFCFSIYNKFKSSIFRKP